MSVNSVQQFLNVRDSHLRVVSGNVHADQMVLGGITVDTSHGLQSVTDTSNVTTNTTTLGGDLTVSGNTFYSNNTSINIDSNVVAEFTGPHSRLPKAVPLKKYPESHVTFNWNTMEKNHNTTNGVGSYYIPGGGYKVSASSVHSQSSSLEGGAYGLYAPWKVFDRKGWSDPSIERYGWLSDGSKYNSLDGSVGSAAITTYNGSSTATGEWLELKLPKKIKLKKFSIVSMTHDASDVHDRMPKTATLLGSNDGSTWSLINDVSLGIPVEGGWISVDVNATEYYKYIRFVVTSTYADGSPAFTETGFTELEYYGYEEDPPAGDISVDTTFKSILNTPQTTGANVYVDAKLSSDFTNQVTGPTPVGTAAAHDNTNKYWEMNGQLTSNITVEANTFLSGDAPHSVSMWFNSSNLEANVSNTCVFSIASEEKLDSVNLDLQSNTWHNLTYAYQGEGGYRVTYLDGRKVSEDQAEDTFGEYPPFAMTGYSHGGYVASFSSAHDNVPWHMWGYDETSGAEEFGWTTPFVNGGGGVAVFEVSSGNVRNAGSGIPNLSGTYQGEYAKLELPYKLVLSYIMIRARAGQSVMAPRDFKVFGSNNDVNWVEILSETGATPSESADTSFYSADVQERGYKYLALVVNKIQPNNTHGQLSLRTLKFYGHRENDLVRFPDPTNVLKYPHIALTGPAQRGYVASASSDNNGNNPAYKVFDHSTSDGWSTSGTYTPSGGFGIPTNSPPTLNGTGVPGEYLILQLPHKLRFSSVKLMPRNTNTDRCAESGNIYGSDDGTNWQLITSFSGKTYTSGNFTTIDINASTAYYRFAIVVTRIGNTANGVNTSIGEMELYGTGVDSIPIQIGGGNIDKVANFRVYNKFIDEDQALEIWDAQKDEFGRAKSSMTLHKGRLGLGTTEPEGRLAVLDEPHNLEEFPPRAMTAEETYFEGHGTFKVALSSADNGNGVIPAFNKKATLSDPSDIDYIEWGSTQYTAATGVYTGSVSTQGVSGEWIEIQMPYKIKLEYNLLYHRNRGGTITNDYWVLERMPRDGAILGSNDGETWTTLQSWTDFDWVTGTSAAGQRQSKYWLTPGKFVTNSTAYYKTFRLVFSKLFGANGDRPNIGEWRLFGTREQGQSVLHDGQLTLTKNLDVPRIGPALDSDDTPRRDRLVVEYNTSTNPTFEGAVRDTSGRGLDGIMHTATYDANDKEIKSNGNSGTENSGPAGTTSTASFNDYGSFETVLPPLQGNPAFTVSGWFKQNTIANLQIPWLIGKNVRVTESPGSGQNTKMSWFGITSTGRPRLAIGGGGNLELLYTDGSIQARKWYHMVITVQPSGTSTVAGDVKFYLNGVSQTASSSGSSGDIDLGGGAPPRMHWFWQESTTVYYDGSASNIKLYDTALTADEVKTLYDMGRCDEGHHVVNFSKTRVGIGLGDGEAPRGALDVRDESYLDNVAGVFNVTGRTTTRRLHEINFPIPPISDTNLQQFFWLAQFAEMQWNFTEYLRFDYNLTYTRGGDYHNRAICSCGYAIVAIRSQGATGTGSQYDNDNPVVRRVEYNSFRGFGEGPNFYYVRNTTKQRGYLVMGFRSSRSWTPANNARVTGTIQYNGNLDNIDTFNGTVYKHGLNATTGSINSHSTLFPSTTLPNNFIAESGDSVTITEATQSSTYFTGQHTTYIENLPDLINYENNNGLIVSSNKNDYIHMTKHKIRGKEAITQDESLPITSLSTRQNDKTCFGVMSCKPFDEYSEKRFCIVNSLGEGAIWVVNTNGNLEAGDYITTSDVSGYGQKQDDDILRNYTVAKITMDCDFNPLSQPIKKILRTETDEYILDEDDQIQWTNTNETEMQYNIRYVDANGTIISQNEYTTKLSEGENVYIAAYVGCTYHCG